MKTTLDERYLTELKQLSEDHLKRCQLFAEQLFFLHSQTKGFIMKINVTTGTREFVPKYDEETALQIKTIERHIESIKQSTEDRMKNLYTKYYKG